MQRRTALQGLMGILVNLLSSSRGAKSAVARGEGKLFHTDLPAREWREFAALGRVGTAMAKPLHTLGVAFHSPQVAE